MLAALRTSTEIAVDLEHHSYRSYGGFLCLMQISTRETDYVIDTLALRDELTELNEIFTDPKIVKVRPCPRIDDLQPPNQLRSSMVLTVILSGFNKILTCMLLTSSIRTMHRNC